MERFIKFISLSLVVFILVTFAGTGYVKAQQVPEVKFSAESSGNEELVKGAALGGLVIVGVWGIFKLVKRNREKRYQNYLEQGKMYLQDGDYAFAINNLEKARKIRRSKEVEKILRRAEKKYQQKHYKLGKRYLEEGSLELAYKEFEKVKKYGIYLDVEQKYNQVYQKLKELKLKRIAVIDFEDSSYRYNLGEKATSLFTAQLLEKDPKFIKIIEREQLGKILEEKKLQASGLVELSKAQDLGKILGVDYLVVGRVISGDVTKDKDSELVDSFENEEKRRYTVKKQAYTQIFFKLLSVSDASIVFSKRVQKRANYSESYYEGESVLAPSDEELIDEALSKAVEVFVQQIYDEFEL